jgi:uncharacterized membrane protein
LEITTVAEGEFSRIVDPLGMVARTQDEWRALWALHAGPESDAPAVDFSERIVAAAFGGQKPSAGYGVQIGEAREDSGVVHLIVTEHAPARGIVAAAILTSPFHIVSLPRTAAEIAWDSSNPHRPASSLQPPTSNLPPPASTGLSPRAASALAYAAGPLSGALMLLAESSNDVVRFHAWQSIVALGGLGIALAASYALAAAALFVSVAGVTLMLDAASVIWIVLALVWLICLWKAWSGERWKLPLAGTVAERLTSRKTS